ncbi:hypothetical protein A6A27_38570 [Micromonospora sp. CB01531]|nr:hypothetical protein A6A27_38570 [Micromonospora sp. CB01531]
MGQVHRGAGLSEDTRGRLRLTGSTPIEENRRSRSTHVTGPTSPKTKRHLVNTPRRFTALRESKKFDTINDQ